MANLLETKGDSGSIITDYDFQKNTYSDSQFLKDTVNKLGFQEETLIVAADGAYGGEDNHALAKENNIKLVTTNFQGKKPSDVFADFEFSLDGKHVLRCANGQIPKTSTFYPKTEQCRSTFDREACNKCPYKEQCKPKFHKSKTSLMISWKTVVRAKQMRYMETEEFKELAKFRNGVESLPSILRRKYNVDHMPVRGQKATKLFFGIKVAALNFKKLLDYQRSFLECTLQPKIC